MSQQVSEEDFRLSPNEQAVWVTFKCKCVVNGVRQFSSDNLRGYGLDKVLYGDEQGKLGSFFRKLLKNGLVKRVGHVASAVESSHGREIKLYEFTEASR